MNKIYTLTLNSLIKKTTASGTLFKLRFFDELNKIYVYDTIQAASIRLNYLLNAADVDTIDALLGAKVSATITEKKGLNKADGKPYAQFIILKYLKGGNKND